MKNIFYILTISSTNLFVFGQDRTPIGTKSDESEKVKLTLVARIQAFKSNPKDTNDVFDETINSPKSVVFAKDNSKFYVHSLEGHTTSVYDNSSNKRIKIIQHKFGESNAALFLNGESTAFDYVFKPGTKNVNTFEGKPVESCLSHDGKYLWVTYYRRSFDANAECPSALAIIDTKTDEIVRVMPTGPLPKMIACSPDNRFISVTHWGDNTVGIINIETEKVEEFKYIQHLIVDKREVLNFGKGKIDRDQNCGNCLRGTVFSPTGEYLLIGKMGGVQGMMIFETKTWTSLGSIKGMYTNLRHIVINNDDVYLSTNNSGYVQKCSLKELVKYRLETEGETVEFTNWQNAYVDKGARTICVTADGKYVFAAVNIGCKIVVVQTSDMSIVTSIKADQYPVGMSLSKDGKKLVVTAQGKGEGTSASGGNSVMIYSVEL